MVQGRREGQGYFYGTTCTLRLMSHRRDSDTNPPGDRQEGEPGVGTGSLGRVRKHLKDSSPVRPGPNPISNKYDRDLEKVLQK